MRDHHPFNHNTTIPTVEFGIERGVTHGIGEVQYRLAGMSLPLQLVFRAIVAAGGNSSQKLAV